MYLYRSAPTDMYCYGTGHVQGNGVLEATGRGTYCNV